LNADELARLYEAGAGKMKIGFVPISLENYVKLHLESNPDMTREEVTESLKEALEAYKQGARCTTCGNPIWVIGSAFVGHNACFTCITGEAMPEDDYELNEAL
jgi:hypothetical protein